MGVQYRPHGIREIFSHCHEKTWWPFHAWHSRPFLHSRTDSIIFWHNAACICTSSLYMCIPRINYGPREYYTILRWSCVVTTIMAASAGVYLYSHWTMTIHFICLYYRTLKCSTIMKYFQHYTDFVVSCSEHLYKCLWCILCEPWLYLH